MPAESPNPTAAANEGVLDSVVIIVQLLEELAAAPAPMGVSELARALDESKARVHRNLVSLKRFGLLDQDEATEKYRLGWKLFQLGERAGVQSNLRDLAEPYLKLLCDKTGQSALLSIPLNGEALVISAVDNSSAVSITVKPGNRPLPHCSAQGRIALAYATQMQRDRLLSGKLKAPTEHAMTDKDRITARLDEIRQRLYEDAPNEALLGVNVLAAPIFKAGGALLGIVSIVGSVQFITSPAPESFLNLVRGVAAALSTQLGSDAYAQAGIAASPEIMKLSRLSSAEA